MQTDVRRLTLRQHRTVRLLSTTPTRHNQQCVLAQSQSTRGHTQQRTTTNVVAIESIEVIPSNTTVRRFTGTGIHGLTISNGHTHTGPGIYTGYDYRSQAIYLERD